VIRRKAIIAAAIATHPYLQLKKHGQDFVLYCTINVSEAVCDVAPEVAFTFSV
jgi:hypothetical protein